VTPGGWKINLESIGYIPYLRCSAPTAPAVLSARGGHTSTDSASESEDPAHTIVKSAAGIESSANTPAGDGVGLAHTTVDENIVCEEATEEEVLDTSRRDLKAEAVSTAHLMDHAGKNPWCEACQLAKPQRKPAKKKTGEPEHPPRCFGDQITADHVVANAEKSQGLTGDKDALVIKDRFTKYVEGYPLPTKNADDAYGAFRDFFGRKFQVNYMWTDDSGELNKCAAMMGVAHGLATPGMPTTNAEAERSVRAVMEGARTLLVQAGLPHCWWPFAMRFWCFAKNIAMINGDSAWNKRHGKGHFTGPRWPFGCRVSFMPTPSKLKELPKGSPRMLTGLLVGYNLQPGGEWKGEFAIVPLTAFSSLSLAHDATHPRTHPQLIKET
jgi:hypothetical protein